MKPNSQPKISSERNGGMSAAEDSGSYNRNFPLVDSNYHVATMPNFHGACARHELPSFRNISGEYFRN
jgi:hypothetical protein